MQHIKLWDVALRQLLTLEEIWHIMKLKILPIGSCKGRQELKEIISNCFPYKRIWGRVSEQIKSDLPSDRSKEEP